MIATPPSADRDPGTSTARTFTTMGTVASLRADGVTSALLEAIVAACLRIDRLFSLYLPDSDLSRIARGEIGLWEADPVVTDAYAQAIEWRSATHGNFTPHRPDGTIDLSGIVKAIAIADVGDVLDAHSSSWLFSVGGDVLARGDREGEPWRAASPTPPVPTRSSARSSSPPDTARSRPPARRSGATTSGAPTAPTCSARSRSPAPISSRRMSSPRRSLPAGATSSTVPWPSGRSTWWP